MAGLRCRRMLARRKWPDGYGCSQRENERGTPVSAPVKYQQPFLSGLGPRDWPLGTALRVRLVAFLAGTALEAVIDRLAPLLSGVGSETTRTASTLDGRQWTRVIPRRRADGPLWRVRPWLAMHWCCFSKSVALRRRSAQVCSKPWPLGRSRNSPEGYAPPALQESSSCAGPPPSPGRIVRCQLGLNSVLAR